MQTFAFLSVIASIGFIVWSLFGAVFATGRRRKRLKLAGVGVILLIGALGFLVHASEQVAREAGYDGMSDRTAADKAGVSDPLIWQERKAEAKRLAYERKVQQDAEAKRKAEIAEEERLAHDKAAAEEQARQDAVYEAERRDAERKAEQEEKARLEQCRNDIQCWAEDAFVTASLVCAEAVQSLAKWDYEWTDGWTEPKLERYRWKDKEKGIVTYLGNKIKFQNGFGAWKRMAYSCDYDPASRSVVSVSVF